MKREISDELISAYLDGELAVEEAQRVEQLLLDSAEHRKLFAELREMGSKIRALPKATLSADFSERVLESATRELQAETRLPAAESVDAGQTLNAKPASEKLAQLPPQRGGWVLAVSLAATAAAAVVALLAFPPDLGHLGGNSVAVAPNASDDSREQRARLSIEKDEQVAKPEFNEESDDRIMLKQEVAEEIDDETPLLELAGQIAEDPFPTARKPQDKSDLAFRGTASQRLNKSFGDEQADFVQPQSTPAKGNFSNTDKLDRETRQSRDDWKQFENKTKREGQIAGDARQEGLAAMANEKLDAITSDDSSSAVPPLLVSPEHFQSAQTAGLKLTIVELSKVVTDHAFADSLRDHRVRLDRLDSIGMQDVERKAGKNGLADEAEADEYQLAILEGAPQNIAAALAEFEVQSQPMAPSKKWRRYAEMGKAGISDASKADSDSESAEFSNAAPSAPKAAQTYNGQLPSPKSANALKPTSKPSDGAIAASPLPSAPGGDRSFSAPTVTPKPFDQPGAAPAPPIALGAGGSAAPVDPFGLESNEPSRANDQKAGNRRPLEEAEQSESKQDAAPGRNATNDVAPSSSIGGGDGAFEKEAAGERAPQEDVDTLQRFALEKQMRAADLADTDRANETPPEPSESETEPTPEPTVRLLVLIRRKQVASIPAADAAESTEAPAKPE